MVPVESAKHMPDQVPRPLLSTKVKAANVVAAKRDSATGVENRTLMGDMAKSRADLYARYSSRSISLERR